MFAENQPESVLEVAAQASEGLLEPNPFIGLDPSDVFATLGELTREAIRTPKQAVEREAALAGALLLSVLTGTDPLLLVKTGALSAQAFLSRRSSGHGQPGRHEPSCDGSARRQASIPLFD